MLYIRRVISWLFNWILWSKVNIINERVLINSFSGDHRSASARWIERFGHCGTVELPRDVLTTLLTFWRGRCSLCVESNFYWTIHHYNSWRMKNQLDVTCYFILFHLLCVQHVSDINISIFRSLWLCWWITTSVVLFSVRCVLEFLLRLLFGGVSFCRLKH